MYQKTDNVPFCRTAHNYSRAHKRGICVCDLGETGMKIYFGSKCKILFNSLFLQSFDDQLFTHSDVKGGVGNVF